MHTDIISLQIADLRVGTQRPAGIAQNAGHAEGHQRADGQAGFEIRFQSLFHEGRAMSFPCDGQGRVDCDALSQRAKDNYLFARAMVGREFGAPTFQWHAGRAH